MAHTEQLGETALKAAPVDQSCRERSGRAAKHLLDRAQAQCSVRAAAVTTTFAAEAIRQSPVVLLIWELGTDADKAACAMTLAAWDYLAPPLLPPVLLCPLLPG